MTLKILVLDWNDRTNPWAGGSELSVHETFGRLARRGHRVTLLCSGYGDAPAEDRLDDLRIVRVGGRHTFHLAVPGALRRLFREEGYDVVVENLNKIPLCTPLWSPAPVVGRGHHLFGGTIFQEAPFPVACVVFASELVLPWVYRDTAMTVVSGTTREDFVRRGLRADRIEVVHNGLDHARYRPAADPPRDPHPSLLCLGRIRRYKRLDLVVEAVGRLGASRHPHLRLTVAGSGDYLDPLRRHAERIGAAPYVRFVGRVSEEEKVRLYRSAWGFVMTSPKEGWGLTCLEAQACGTPVIASDSPGLKEAVRHEASGLLVPHGDGPGLERAVDRLVSDDALRARLSAGAIAHAGEYSWDRCADEMLRAMQRAVAARADAGVPA